MKDIYRHGSRLSCSCTRTTYLSVFNYCYKLYCKQQCGPQTRETTLGNALQRQSKKKTDFGSWLKRTERCAGGCLSRMKVAKKKIRKLVPRRDLLCRIELPKGKEYIKRQCAIQATRTSKHNLESSKRKGAFTSEIEDVTSTESY